jgi:hypothetical protein
LLPNLAYLPRLADTFAIISFWPLLLASPLLLATRKINAQHLPFVLDRNAKPQHAKRELGSQRLRGSRCEGLGLAIHLPIPEAPRDGEAHVTLKQLYAPVSSIGEILLGLCLASNRTNGNVIDKEA